MHRVNNLGVNEAQSLWYRPRLKLVDPNESSVFSRSRLLQVKSRYVKAKYGKITKLPGLIKIVMVHPHSVRKS